MLVTRIESEKKIILGWHDDSDKNSHKRHGSIYNQATQKIIYLEILQVSA